MNLWLDLETRSRVNVKRVGAWRYARDPSTEVTVITTAWNEDKPEAITNEELRIEVGEADVIYSHNAQFERDILKHVLHIDTDVDKWVDTAAYAAANGLPRKLETLCKVLHLPRDQAKDKRGARLISMLCSPQKDGTFNDDPKLYAEFVEYCMQDVVAMRECWHRLPDKALTPSERRIMQVDMLINERGVCVDTGLAKAAQAQYARIVANADALVAGLTGGEVNSTTEVEKLRVHLDGIGCALPNLRATTVEDALKGELDEVARELLELRQIGSKTGGAKFDRFVELSDVDGRAHDLHMYYAAHTGRWGGRMLQPQNMPRPTISDTDVAAEIVRNDEINMFYDKPMSVLNSVVRSCIIAPPGKALLVGDYAQIEARIVPWLAGQEDVLTAFRNGEDIYKVAATGIFRVPLAEVTKAQRAVGKVAILALGFGGGSAAFESMAKQYRVPVPDNVEAIVKAWRTANRKIVSFWYDLDRAFRNLLADDYNGDVLKVGKVKLSLKGKTVRIELPNGLMLRYHGAKINENDEVTYLGVNPKTFNWSVLYTWGGKITQNITEFVGRCLLGESLVDLEDVGLRPVLHVHDEVVCESDVGRLADFKACLERPRAWAAGLPVVADCHEMLRYRKM
jgi:DNA polymerase